MSDHVTTLMNLIKYRGKQLMHVYNVRVISLTISSRGIKFIWLTISLSYTHTNMMILLTKLNNNKDKY